MNCSHSLETTSSLARVLCRGLGPSPLLAFTGSGGKTTTSELLGRAATAAGHRVIITTTTKIRVPLRHAPVRSLDDVREALRSLGPALDPPEPLFAGDAASDGKKLTGPSLDLLEEMRRARVADVILVEADGSRGASVKRYRAEEPVMPLHVDRTCVLLGVDVLGADLHSPLVHRAEHLWPWLGLAPGERLAASDVARAIFLQPEYLDCGGPRVTLLLNKVDSPPLADNARALLAAFEPYLEASPLEGVHWRGSLVAGEVECLWERTPRRITALLPAAGNSVHFGALKQAALVEGMPMVKRAPQTVLHEGVDEGVPFDTDVESGLPK